LIDIAIAIADGESEYRCTALLLFTASGPMPSDHVFYRPHFLPVNTTGQKSVQKRLSLINFFFSLGA